MWNLNDEPDRPGDDVSEACSTPKTVSGEDDKGKRWVIEPSASNSSSSALLPEDVSDEDDNEVAGEGCPMDKGRGWDGGTPAVTRQFFPMDEGEGTGGNRAGDGFPWAPWVGVRFCRSDPATVAEPGTVTAPWAGGPSSPQPQQVPSPMMMKKSRRGPRSRSSQFRGVTFYRRTGRWESHIW